MAVTVSQLGPVLNPHGPDLRKYPSSDCCEVLSNDISAGQAMITMCPRGDLNPETGEISLITDLNSKTGEKSPDRGVHAATVHLADALRRDSPGRRHGLTGH